MLLFQGGQKVEKVETANAVALFGLEFELGFQRPVRDETRTTKEFRQRDLLLFGWKNSVSVGFQHCFNQKLLLG